MTTGTGTGCASPVMYKAFQDAGGTGGHALSIKTT